MSKSNYTILRIGKGYGLSVSKAQVEALRHLLDRDPLSSTINTRTGRVLINLGLAETDGAFHLDGRPYGGRTFYKLTHQGRAAISEYVERTGNGPEDLKALFTF